MWTGIHASYLLWDTVGKLILDPGPKTIEGITDKLVIHEVICIKENYEAYQSAKELVFSILGWQTMLYKPDFLSSQTGNSAFSMKWMDTKARHV